MASSNLIKSRILVWDAPTRVFHWLLAFCFVAGYLTSEGRGVMGLHVALGYTMAGLIAFRVVWGLVGTRYARFGSFIRGPSAVASYAADMLNPKAEHPVGHNPLGAVSIVLMLLTGLAIVFTGWVYINGGAHSLKELHEGAAGFMLMVVAVHLAGVVFASMMQRENLAVSMLSGYKQGRADQAIRWSWWPVAMLLLAGVLAFWYWQWQSPSQITLNGGGYSENKGWRGEDDD